MSHISSSSQPADATSSATADRREFNLSDFDFELPESLIAQHPAAVRSASRLLDARTSELTDRIFNELPDLLQPGVCAPAWATSTGSTASGLYSVIVR